MGSEAAEIDDVLKESEALLNRLQSQSCYEVNSGCDDVHDGGASVASIGSFSLRDAGSVLPSVADSTAWDDGSRVGDIMQVGKGDSSQQLAVKQPGIQRLKASSEALSAPLPRPPPQWEKVSSAAAGDDDYVPLADYTKEKPKDVVPSIRASTVRVSRLEAYREKALKMRRRRRVVAFVIAVLLAFVLGTWLKRAHLSRDNQAHLDHTNTTNFTTKSRIDTDTDLPAAKPQYRTSLETETDDSPRMEVPALESCPNYANAEFPKLEHVKEPKLLATETNDDRNDGERGVYSHDNPTSEMQKKEIPNCKNPFVRVFSRRCREESRQRKNELTHAVASH